MLWRITSETGLLEIWGIQEMTNYDPTGSPINAHPAPWSYERYIERVKHILIKNGPTSIGDYAFAGLCLTETVSIPNTITNIGSNAFAGLDVIKEIELPTSIKTIGDNAFLGCKAAGSIFIPSEVASIGKNAFPYGVTVSSRNKYYSSDEYGALFDASKETLIRVPITHTGEYIVPSTVKKIAPNAFDGCTAITAVYFGKNLVEIGERAFAKCEKLKGLYFDGNSPKSQDNYANYIGVISTSLPTIYYRKNSTGWASPHWNSFPTKIWDAQYCCLGSKCGSHKFKDLPAASNWAHSGIDFAINEYMFYGTSDTLFSPSMPMTRAMLVTVLWRYSDKPYAHSQGFTDISQNTYYTTAVNWAAKEGIVNGVGNNKFDPDANITREQLVTILYRYAKWINSDTKANTDISFFCDYKEISHYAVEALSWAYAEGIISGVSSDRIDPTGFATRAQVATILSRFINH